MVAGRSEWLAPGEAGKSKSRTILSKARRESGMRIVGAAAVGEGDWVLLLTSDGRLTSYRATEMLSAGSLLDRDSALDVLSFAIFRP